MPGPIEDDAADAAQALAELDYERGSRAAWSSMLAECLRHLGYDGTEGQRIAWISEREQAIAALRMVCDDWGDNDWPDDLHLADIIEKHLHDPLEEFGREAGGP